MHTLSFSQSQQFEKKSDPILYVIKTKIIKYHEKLFVNSMFNSFTLAHATLELWLIRNKK